MIMYCLGERALIEKEFTAAGERHEALNLGDDEVLFTTIADGKRYAATGEVPFGNMSVLEYVSYNRSTALGRRIRDDETRYYARLFGVKVGLKRKLKTLDPIDFRAVQFLSLYDMAVRETYLRFDSLDFSRAARKKLHSLIRRLGKYFNVFVAVSDYRFVPFGSAIRFYSGDRAVTVPTNEFITRCRPKKYAAKVLGDACGGLKIRKLVEIGKDN